MEKIKYNYDKLRKKFKELGIKEKEVAKELGISKSTLSLKLNNRAIFSQDEILKILLMLNLSDSETKEYFLTQKV